MTAVWDHPSFPSKLRVCREASLEGKRRREEIQEGGRGRGGEGEGKQDGEELEEEQESWREREEEEGEEEEGRWKAKARAERRRVPGAFLPWPSSSCCSLDSSCLSGSS